MFHARKTIEEAKGSFEINSVEGSGTQVMLKLPRSSPPVWFKSEIRLDGHSTLVSVDDDVSIHEIWSRRLQELKAHCPELLRFSTSKELGSWLKNHPGANKSTIFLIDYELIGQKEDGVELITRLGLIDRSILVTSRFEEPQLQDRCIKIGLRILPKFLSQYVPIVVDHGL